MAGTNGQTTDALIAELGREPYAFDFYALVRLLQSRFPDHPRIGHSSSPAQDPVRFAQSTSLEFAPSTLEAAKSNDPTRPPEIYSRHFGLFCPTWPCPLSPRREPRAPL